MNITWDAKNYTDNFSFVHQYGNDVLSLLELTPGMTVLDLGCGNGALTAKLRELGARPTGMDASFEQLAIASDSYPDLTFIQGDATAFSLPQPVDAVFSNAVFHWIDRENQPAMLECITKALEPGGQLVFEMGGYRCGGTVHDALAAAFAKRGLDYQMPFFFPTVGEYTPMLEQAGLLVTHAFLFDCFTPLKGDDGLVDWINMFVKKPFEGMEENQKTEICREVADQLKPQLYRDGIWYCDYVRLRCRAIRK